MRLIDADELEKVMTEDWFLEILATQDSKSAIKKDIVNCIDSVPLAYNAEQVISDLESEKMILCGCHMIETNVIKIDDAIEIVRKGGMNG